MMRVLIADRTVQNRRRVVKFLTHWDPNVEVFEAGSGAEAVGSAMTDLPNLIFMGGEMPIFDGAVAASILRKNPGTRTIPMIGLLQSEDSPEIKKRLNQFCDTLLEGSVEDYRRFLSALYPLYDSFIQ